MFPSLGRVSSFHATLFLNRLRVFRPGIAMFNCPIQPISNGTIQFRDAEFDLASASKSGRYEVENSIHKLGENWTHFLLGKVRPNQSDSTIRYDETVRDEIVSVG